LLKVSRSVFSAISAALCALCVKNLAGKQFNAEVTEGRRDRRDAELDEVLL